MLLFRGQDCSLPGPPEARIPSGIQLTFDAAPALNRIRRRIQGVKRTRRRRLQRLPTRSLLIDAEDAPGERRRDNPLALIGQPIETGQQRLIDLLTRVSQISQRLAAIEPRIRHAPCAKTSIAHHHETSATFNAHEAAGDLRLFMVYTYGPLDAMRQVSRSVGGTRIQCRPGASLPGRPHIARVTAR